GSASRGRSLKASTWYGTKSRIGSATSADLKDFSSGWPKNSAESQRFHVDRGWTSRGHGRKRGTEGGNLGDFDLRSCAFSLIGRLVMRVKRLLGRRDDRGEIP